MLHARGCFTPRYKVFINFAEQGIDIRKIWAKSSTVPGIKLCRDFGFTEMGYINNDQIGFVLDMETSQKSFAVKYREALVETKNSQSRTAKTMRKRLFSTNKTPWLVG